jgi:hypothetical protein
MKSRITLILLLIGTNFTLPAQEIITRANEFLALLSPALKARTQFDLEDAERFNWHFVPIERKGTTLGDYSEVQRKAAWAFLKASVSEQGFLKAHAITELENVLMVVEKQKPDSHYRDPLNYHFFVFGTPSRDQPWGWRFEGHHVSISIMFDKGQIVSSTPSFFGTNPGIVLDGPEKGKEVLKKETDLGFAFVKSLSAEQLKQALIAEKAPAEILSFDKRKTEALAPDGIKFSALTDPQKKQFLGLMDLYIMNYELGFSTTLEKKIRSAGIDNLSFAWAGSLSPGVPNYYRIQGPTLLIEYDNTQNNANHVHTAVRDLTNDFAEDILKEHYLKEHAGK